MTTVLSSFIAVCVSVLPTLISLQGGATVHGTILHDRSVHDTSLYDTSRVHVNRPAEPFGTIAVRILSALSPKSVELSGRNTPLSIAQNGSTQPARVDVGSRFEIRNQAGELAIAGSASKDFESSGRVDALTATPEGNGLIEIRIGDVHRAYPGIITVSVSPNDGTLVIYNHVDIEEYVASVVASEYGLRDEEGTKAMAVVARTYALRAQQSERSRLNLLDDSRSQVYRGFDSITTQSRQAAISTAGQTVSYDGSLIQALYSSSNGGRTAANESIWAGEPVPYLRHQKDPYDSVSPHTSWTISINRDELHRRLSDRYEFTVASVRFGGEEKDGRIRTVALLDSKGSKKREITGGAFRAFASTNDRPLKSTFFTVRERGDNYEFKGRGFGHGVGLSQWGAHGMALDGNEYDDILAFYYPGTSVDARAVGAALAVNSNPENSEGVSGAQRATTSTTMPSATRTSSGRQVVGWGGKYSLPATQLRTSRRRVGW